ncbi:MAG: RagB/SusD family nutrient uptake outer membrane protein, partial [Bacteroidota bacterium]
MKNTIQYIFLGVVLLISSCQDPFELVPQDIISDTVVFEDEGLADAFLADLYERALLWNDDRGFIERNLINAMGGESRNFAPWQSPFGAITDTDFDETGAGILEHWPYQLIRECNVYIDKLSQSTTLNPDYVATRVAEARFIRAWEYFEMAKLYGGVPLVTEALPLGATEEELLVPRNSEKEVYDFIASELDLAVAALPEMAEKEGRITRWAALAFKGRAMLYAASVAQFGTQQLGGLLGFPASDADAYYRASMEASKEIIDNGNFALYRGAGTPFDNLTNMWLDESGANTEKILVEKYDEASGKDHSWDIHATPAGFGSGWNSNFPVYLETFEFFDFVDGRSGKLDRSIYDGNTPIDPADYFEKRDPRFKAWVFYPGAPFKDSHFFSHRKTFYTDPADGVRKESTSRGSIFAGATDYLGAQVDWPGQSHPRHHTANPTGMIIRKFVDPSFADRVIGSSTDVVILRYGEVLLNYAEAAFYLGNPNGDVLTVLNDIRDRAGMPLFEAGDVTEET